MQVLSIGSDRNICDPNSAVALRAKAYAEKFGSLTVIVFSRINHGKRPITFGNVSVYPTNSKSRLWYGFDALTIARKLPQPDVIDTQDPFEAGLIGMWLSRTLKVPLHVQIHTDLTSPYFKSIGFNRIRVAIAHRVLTKAARIRVVSEKIKQGLTDHFKVSAPVSVLPIFVDVQRFANASVSTSLESRFSHFKHRFLVVSRLEPEKNPCEALRAFAQSKAADSCLIFLGEGSEQKILTDLAKKFHVEKEVFFEGYTDPSSYYKLADLVLVPSRYEGYGMTIVEALAAGTPVLSTDVGVAKEAGAMVVDDKHFSSALKEWISTGVRGGILKHYPYTNEQDYISLYVEDIEKTSKQGTN